jgi:hypothetical protein
MKTRLRPTPKGDEAVPRAFTTFVLGASGSGKTALLASIYDRLSTPIPELGFYLHAERQQATGLIHRYRELMDPEAPWPAGTAAVTEYDFACRCTWSNQDLFHFRYLDFPGGLITDYAEDDDETLALAEEVRAAQSILVLLDGEKILYFMKGQEPPILNPITFDLRFLLPLISNAASGVPVHFVITKWDILAAHFSLGQVRDALEAFPQFQNVIRARQASSCPTRLIPVSALGDGVARLDDKGRMVKRGASVKAQPYQVELSIACALADGFRVAHRRAQAEQDLLATHRVVLLAALMRVLTALLRLFSVAAEHGHLVLPRPYDLGAAQSAKLMSSFGRRLDRGADRMTEEIEAQQEQVASKESSLITAIQRSEILCKQLEREHPGSKLAA